MNEYPKKEYYVLDYVVFNALVTSEYGLPLDRYNFAEDMEVNNHSAQTFTNLKKKPLDKYEAEHLHRFKFTVGLKPNYVSWILLQDMCNNDVLPEGNYLIEVMW